MSVSYKRTSLRLNYSCKKFCRGVKKKFPWQSRDETGMGKKSQAFDRTMNKEGMDLAAEPDQLVGQFLTWEQLDRSRV